MQSIQMCILFANPSVLALWSAYTGLNSNYSYIYLQCENRLFNIVVFCCGPATDHHE